MEFYQAAVLIGTVVLIAILSSYARQPHFLALSLGALVFALLARMSLPSIGDSFSLGFAQTVDSYGLIIIAGSITATFLTRSGVNGRLVPANSRSIAALAAGLCASLVPSTIALALMRPWCQIAAGSDARARARVVTTLALALSAGQAFMYPSLYAVATRAILKVDLGLMLAIGLALALATAAAGWAFVKWMTPRLALEGRQDIPAPADTQKKTGTLGAAVVPVLVPLLLLITATFAQIPTEPLGRDLKEFLVFMTRPMVMLLLSIGLIVLTLRRFDRKTLAETGWMGEALSASVRPLLALGAAGGFVALIQQTGMAELIAERVSVLHIGIAVPFLVAALLKALQGSPLVATLTAAGMMEPLLPGLGLDGAWGHAHAAAAIGAGTLIVHVNDPLFWLVRDMADMTPGRTLALHTLGTLVQAATALVLLMVLAAF